MSSLHPFLGEGGEALLTPQVGDKQQTFALVNDPGEHRSGIPLAPQHTFIGRIILGEERDRVNDILPVIRLYVCETPHGAPHRVGILMPEKGR